MLGHHVAHAVHDVFEHRAEELVPVGEVAARGGHAHACLLSDVAQRHARPHLGDERGGDLHNRLTVFGSIFSHDPQLTVDAPEVEQYAPFV